MRQSRGFGSFLLQGQRLACSDLDTLHFSSTPTANNNLEASSYVKFFRTNSPTDLKRHQQSQNLSAVFLGGTAAKHCSCPEGLGPQVCPWCLSSHFASRSGALGHDAIFGFHHQRPSQSFLLEFVDVLLPCFRTPSFKDSKVGHH